MTEENILLPLLSVLFSTILIYGPKLYNQTNKIIYLIITLISTNALVYVIYRMFYNKYSVVVTTLCGKIIPTIILTLLGFFVVKDEKVTKIKLLGLVVIILGMIMVVADV